MGEGVVGCVEGYRVWACMQGVHQGCRGCGPVSEGCMGVTDWGRVCTGGIWE